MANACVTEAVNPQSRRKSIMYKAAAPINLRGPIKSYQSVGASGWMVLFQLTFLRSSSADALVPARRWRVRWSGRDVERSHEIGASRRRVDETSRQIFEAGVENDGGGRVSERKDGRNKGWEVEKARRGREEAREVSSLGLAVSRRLAILRCDIRAEKVAVSFRTLKYIREERENDETPRIWEAIARRFLWAQDISQRVLEYRLNRFSKICGLVIFISNSYYM